MAIIKATNSKASLRNITKYVTNPEKTKKELITGKDIIDPQHAYEQMMDTKKMYKSTKGRQYIHVVQSFKEGEIDPKKANQIGQEWADKCYKGHEVLIVTHTDKAHIHNHFVINTVNFETGKKHQSSKKDYADSKEISNKICKREGLSIPEKGTEITSSKTNEYQVILNAVNGKGESWKLKTAQDTKQAVSQSTSKKDFIKKMETKGYKVNWKDTRKNITFTNSEGKKVRSSNLTKTFKYDFSKENMDNEFRRNHESEKNTGARDEERNSNRAEPTTSDVHRNGQDKIPTQSDARVLGGIEQNVHDATERVQSIFKPHEQEDRRDEQLDRSSEQGNEQNSQTDADQRRIDEERLRREQEENERERAEKLREYDLER